MPSNSINVNVGGHRSSIISRLFRRKSLAEARSLQTPLKRCLSVWHLTFYGIAHMAGAGIYVLTGTIVKNKAGPAASLSFLLSALASLFTGLCYVEFSTFIPRAGSCYTFTYLTLGELPAFIIGWTMIADIIIGLASVAKAFSSTVDTVAAGAVSNWTMHHFGQLPQSDMLDPCIDLVASGLILLLMLLTVCGASVSLSLNIALSTVQCGCLILMAVMCFVCGSGENWKTHDGKSGFFPFGVGGMISGATVAIFAFSGFEAIANAAEEARDPRSSLPIALLTSLAAITVLYFASSLGVSYLQHYSLLDVGSPFVAAFSSSSAPWMQYVAATGTLLATGATKLAAIYVLPRMLYALAADGIVMRQFAYVHPKLGVPLIGLAFGGSLSAVLAMLFNIGTLANFVSMGVLLSYLFIGINLFHLRYFYFHSNDSQSYTINNYDDNNNSSSSDNKSSSSTGGSVQYANLHYLRPWASRIISWCPTLLFCLRRHRTLQALFVIYLFCCLISSLLLNLLTELLTWWSITAVAASGCVLAVTAASLCMYEPYPIDAYSAPLMPVPPLISLFINCLLITKLQMLTWLRFLVWLLIGLTMYIGYGLFNAGSESTNDYIQLPTAECGAMLKQEEQELGIEFGERTEGEGDAESQTSDDLLNVPAVCKS